MKNFLQNGDVIDVATPAGGSTSGDLAVIGALVGVMTLTADAGEPNGLQRTGAFSVPKVGAALVVGDEVEYVAASKSVQKKAAGNAIAAVIAPAVAADTSVEIVLL